MALTRDFKQTIAARARRDSRFREALFTEAINAYLAGDTSEGKAILRDLVNATIGFEGLAAEIRKPSKSLHRMLAPRGNPSTDNFFSIVSALQKKTHVKLRVEDQLTIRLPRELSQAVKSAARRAQRRPSEVVRMALQAFLDVAPSPAGRPADRVRGLLGSLKSGIPDLAEKHRAYILDSLKNAR